MPRTWLAVAFTLVCFGLAATVEAADQADRKKTAPLVDPADAGYVNPRLCFGCHASIYKTYQATGMARSFARPSPANTVEDYTKNNRFFHAASNTWFEMLTRGGEYFQRRYQIGFGGKPTNIDETRIDYFLGSAIHARAYLHRTRAGGLAQLPVVWYSENGGHWGMAPGYDSASHLYGLRSVSYDCLFCHNAFESIPATNARLGDEPVYSGVIPEGIDCQRCHGPGRKHLKAAGRSGAPVATVRQAIVNPGRLDPDRDAEVCYQCHLQTTGFSLPRSVKRYDRGDYSYRPGEQLADFKISFGFAPTDPHRPWYENVSTATRMRMSQCFLRSNGALKCTTCHDPHDVQHGPESRAHYNNVCSRCHATAFQAEVAAGRHNTQTDCIGCHMPLKRPIEVVHIEKTDHYIQRNKPLVDLLQPADEYRETAANIYRGPVSLYYPNSLPASSENQMYLAIAQVRDKSNLGEGIPQLIKALEVAHQAIPEPYFELATALQAAGQLDQAIAQYREALKLDAGYSPAMLGIGTAFKQEGLLAQAANSFAAATLAAPDNPKAWNELGQADIDLDRRPDALAALKRAVAIDPEMPQAHNGLGAVLAQSGDFAAAEKEFREAIRILPNYGEAHGNLAGVLDLEKDLPQAVYEFDVATKLAPGDAATHLNYGAVLSREHRADEARREMEAAVRANPSFAEAHEMLGRLYEQKNQTDQALNEYREAVRLRPDMSQAQLDPGAVLAKKGDKAGAREHLRQASGAADETLRRIALQLLEELK